MNQLFRLQLAGLATIALGFSGCASGGGGGGSMTPVAGAQVGDQPVDPAMAAAGKALWERHGCYTCHAFGRRLAGPDLTGVTQGRTQEWLRKWFADTDAMIDGDPIGQALLEQWKGVRMPNFRLSQREADAIIHYMALESARAQRSE